MDALEPVQRKLRRRPVDGASTPPFSACGGLKSRVPPRPKPEPFRTSVLRNLWSFPTGPCARGARVGTSLREAGRGGP